MEVLTKIGLAQEDRSSRNSSTGGKFKKLDFNLLNLRRKIMLVDLNYTRGKIISFFYYCIYPESENIPEFIFELLLVKWK